MGVLFRIKKGAAATLATLLVIPKAKLATRSWVRSTKLACRREKIPAKTTEIIRIFLTWTLGIMKAAGTETMVMPQPVKDKTSPIRSSVKPISLK